MQLCHLPSAANPADVLTKAVPWPRLELHLLSFGLRQNKSEQVVTVICHVDVDVPRCCDRPMALMVLPTGFVSWQCARDEAHLVSWSSYLSGKGLSGRVGHAVVSRMAFNREVREGRAASSGPEVPPTYAGSGPSAASSSSVPPPYPGGVPASSSSGPSVVLPPPYRVELEPPTQRQLNYRSLLCAKQRLSFDQVLGEIRSKADASAWIDQHKSR